MNPVDDPKFKIDFVEVCERLFAIVENPVCANSVKVAVATFGQTILKELYPNVN